MKTSKKKNFDDMNAIKDSVEEVKDEVDKIFTDNNDNVELTQTDFSEKVVYIITNDKGDEYKSTGPGITDYNLYNAKTYDNEIDANKALKELEPLVFGNWKVIKMPAKKFNKANKNGLKALDNVLGKPPKEWTKEDELNELENALNPNNFSQKPYVVCIVGNVKGKKELALVDIRDEEEVERPLKAFNTEKEAMKYMDALKKKYPDKYFWEDYNFSQVYKVADLPFTFLKRKQIGIYTIFDCEDCQVKIKTDKLDKNSSLVKVKNFAEDNIDSNNTWQEKLAENVINEIERQGLDDLLTVTIDNVGDIVLANIDTENEFVVHENTDPKEYKKFLTDNGLKVDNIKNFSMVNFGIVNAIEKLAVKGLNNIASKGQQKGLMAAYLGYAMKRYEQAINAIQDTINVAPKGILQGHLRRLLLNGDLKSGKIANFKSLQDYYNVLSKVSKKLNNDASVQAYKNADQLQKQLDKLHEQAQDYADEQDKQDESKTEDINTLTERKNAKELGQLAKDKVLEFQDYCKEKGIKLPDIKESGGLKSWAEKVMSNTNELDKDKEAYKKAREILDIAQKQVIAKGGDKTVTNEINSERIDDFIVERKEEVNNIENKLKKLKEKFDETKNKKEKQAIREEANKLKEDLKWYKDSIAKAENMKNKKTANYKGFSEELNNITSPFVTEFFAEKVQDSDFGICYQDKFGSLWSADPDTNKNATLLWQSKDGKEVPKQESDDTIMDESEMDDTLGIESDEDEESGEDEDFDFGDEESSEDEDFDFEEEESDDLGFSEDESEDDDFDFGEDEEDEDFDFEDTETEEETSTSEGNPDMQKALDVLNSMYDKLYELAKGK